MRVTVFFLALLCLSSISIRGHGQEATDVSTESTGIGSSISIGAKAGGNLSQFSQPGAVMTGNIGGFVRMGLLPFAELQAEVLYNVIGGGRRELQRDLGMFQVTEVNGPVESLSYLNRQVFVQTVSVPVSLRLGIPTLEGSAIQPKFLLGGGYAYVIRADEMHDTYFTFNDGSRIILSDTQENVTADYYEHNLSLHGGFELDFALENQKTFSFGLIFSQGFTDLNNIKLGQPENIEKLRTRSMSFNFSYTIF